jgi:hypothetical protein
MKYLVQTENITEEKNKDLSYNRVILDTTDNSVYVVKGDGYNLIDLGLPSGTLWMDRNLGAKEITDSGLYFQWGDIQGYTREDLKNKKFYFDDYKYYNISTTSITKYNETDSLTELESSDDAAYVYTNNKCKVPTKAQFQELLDETTYTWTTKDGVSGGLFTSKTNNNSIFVPAAGFLGYGNTYDIGNIFALWSSSLYEGNSRNAWYLCYYTRDYCTLEFRGFAGRNGGFSIRGCKSVAK